MALENRNVAGKEKNMLTSVMDIPLQDAAQASSYYLEDGSFVKLDNITLGWTPKLNTKWISNLRVYGTLKNVFTLTKYSGVDPTTVTTTGLWPGIGGMEVYPTARNLTFGVQITY